MAYSVFEERCAGVPNLRDIGGYPTIDGHRVRRGLLFRSGQLTQLTDRECTIVAKLNIAAVCDFRTAGERDAAPTRWAGSTPEIVSLPNVDLDHQQFRQQLAKGTTAIELANLMAELYATTVAAYAPSFAIALHIIVNTDRPVLYHCSAGKDRTGIFTALLLSFLGVERETVIQDYLLSNRHVATDRHIDTFADEMNVASAFVRILFCADRAYLQAAFEAIDRRYASLNGYRRSALGCSDEDLDRLKARLLK